MPATHHEVFRHPRDRDVGLWRYMDFTKYVSMLENNGLYLGRADLVGDPFEGSITKMNVDSLEATFLRIGVPYKLIKETTKNATKTAKSIRERMYLNCWHANDVESVAMWKLYSKSNEAVAIKSTFRKLHDGINGTEENPFHIGLVTYIDYNKTPVPPGNLFWPYTHKRKSFEHEREVRIVYFLPPTRDDVKSSTPDKAWGGKTPSGIWHKIKIEEVIEGVYVSPDCDAWLRDIVESVTRRYGLKLSVAQSSLKTSPIF